MTTPAWPNHKISVACFPIEMFPNFIQYSTFIVSHLSLSVLNSKVI